MTSYDDASDGHPDLAEIDALRTGEADAAIREHVDRCTRCAETLAALEDEARALSGLRREAREEDTDADRRAVETIFAEAARIRGSARRRGLLLRIASTAPLPSTS